MDPSLDPPTDEQPIAERLGFAWRELRRAATSAPMTDFGRGPEAALLELPQFDTLEQLAFRPDGWRMSDLAEALRVDPSTATRSVDRLERFGLAKRATSDSDRRVVVATITPLGELTLRRHVVQRTTAVGRVIATMSAAEQIELVRQFERLVELLNTFLDDVHSGDGGYSSPPL